jgi:D-serine deaminase-like pyridoxal phosphate-dependent protein
MSSLVSELDTPALIVDLDVMESNIAEMAGIARRAGVKLRPHTKTHKSVAIARKQMDAGAAGITVAKLGEAEVMADAGFDDILVAYPLWGEQKLRHLRDLLERSKVRVSLDSVDVARGIGSAGLSAGVQVEVLVEVDTGFGRCGRPPGEPTVDLVRGVSEIEGLRVAGLLTHAGHSYKSETSEDLQAIANREGADLVRTAELCARAGIEIEEVSVGSTPTVRYVATVPGVTEIRPGTYVFNDATMMRLGVASVEQVAARVLATVVSRPADERFVIDAGTKALAADWMGAVDDWLLFDGRPDLHIEFLTEEHGVGTCPPGSLAIGDRLEVIPSHICPVFNLFDVAFGVRDVKVVEELTIDARARVR